MICGNIDVENIPLNQLPTTLREYKEREGKRVRCVARRETFNVRCRQLSTRTPDHFHPIKTVQGHVDHCRELIARINERMEKEMKSAVELGEEGGRHIRQGEALQEEAARRIQLVGETAAEIGIGTLTIAPRPQMATAPSIKNKKRKAKKGKKKKNGNDTEDEDEEAVFREYERVVAIEHRQLREEIVGRIYALHSNHSVLKRISHAAFDQMVIQKMAEAKLRATRPIQGSLYDFLATHESFSIVQLTLLLRKLDEITQQDIDAFKRFSYLMDSTTAKKLWE